MSPKVTDPGTLRTLLEGARKTGKRIVFTNGCFDIVHVGHVRYLREAGKLGDILVVGLNSDRSVSSLKSGRPVTPEVQRAEVLAALEMVDYVVVFDEETPYELIKLLKPDVLVKGRKKTSWGRTSYRTREASPLSRASRPRPSLRGFEICRERSGRRGHHCSVPVDILARSGVVGEGVGVHRGCLSRRRWWA
jgi:rfaE bifunctional protein nucleotidyltransferase chain/domain